MCLCKDGSICKNGKPNGLRAVSAKNTFELFPHSSKTRSMKKITFLFVLFLFAATASKAQSFCDADFSINVPGITFSSVVSWGDSGIYISITNNSGLNYAYPQAKLFNT